MVCSHILIHIRSVRSDMNTLHDPVLLKFTMLREWNCQLGFLIADGQDGSGLQFEKFGSFTRKVDNCAATTVL